MSICHGRYEPLVTGPEMYPRTTFPGPTACGLDLKVMHPPGPVKP